MRSTIGRLTAILHRQSQVYINHALREFGITSAEYAFLLYLFHKDGKTQDELSSYLYIDKSATARAVSSLEHKGYVVRSKDGVDKRYNRIFLTEKALQRKEDIRKRVRAWSEFLTGGMDEETIESVIIALETMVDKVEHTDLRKGLEEELDGTGQPLG